MKKLLSIILVLTMCLTMFTACKKDAEQPAQTSLEAAAEYLFTMYKDASPATYSTDYQVVSVVKIGTETFQITWTANVEEEFVKIVPGETLTTIDVNNEVREDVNYTLTATLKDADGNTATVNFERSTPGAIIIDDTLTQAELVEIAYSLEEDMVLDQAATLTGVISKIDTAWSDQYQNITVTIVVGGDTEHPIMCYRLKGDGAATLVVGDTITVTGYFKNYKGTVEFDAGCTLDNVVKAEGNEDENAGNEGNTGNEGNNGSTGNEGNAGNNGSTGSGDANNGGSSNEGSNNGGSEYKTPAEIIAAAYALEKDTSLEGEYTLTGVIKSIDSAYSDQYQNITVTIIVDGDTAHPIVCYRMKGDGAEDLVPGDTITVTGTLMNYNNVVEFASGCSLDHVEKTGDAVTVLTDPVEIVKAAYALGLGESLPYQVSLTGTITEIQTAYSEQYKNITVVITIAGAEDMPIVCYRLKGTGAETLAVGDVITVTGTLTNYTKDNVTGLIEFTSGCTFVKP